METPKRRVLLPLIELAIPLVDNSITTETANHTSRHNQATAPNYISYKIELIQKLKIGKDMMPIRAVKQKKESIIHKRCMDTKLTKCLDLSGLKLYILPKGLYRLGSSLRHLYLHNCSLKDEFPFEIVHLLTHLETLDLSQNNLTLIPDSFCMTAKRLEVLDVSYNQLYRLPGSLDELTSLRELNAAHNKLIYIPSELGKLQHIQEIDLNTNCILGLPSALFGSQATFSLRSIDISHNQISELPVSISNVRGLLSLKVSNNKLKYLPVECRQLNNLETLYYGGNEWYAKDSYTRCSGKVYGVKALITAVTLSL